MHAVLTAENGQLIFFSQKYPDNCYESNLLEFSLNISIEFAEFRY